MIIGKEIFLNSRYWKYNCQVIIEDVIRITSMRCCNNLIHFLIVYKCIFNFLHPAVFCRWFFTFCTRRCIDVEQKSELQMAINSVREIMSALVLFQQLSRSHRPITFFWEWMRKKLILIVCFRRTCEGIFLLCVCMFAIESYFNRQFYR